MATNNRIKDGLDRAARIIAAEDYSADADIFMCRNNYADVDKLKREFGPVADMSIAYLRMRVEALSLGKRTIRRAAWYLFERPPTYEWGRICLAVCDAGTPEGRVTELSEDLTLVLLAPANDALLTNVQQASSQMIATRRHEIAQRKDEAVVRQVADEESEKFLASLLLGLSDLIRDCRDPEVAAEIERERKLINDPTLEQIAGLCYRLGGDLWYLLRDY